MKYTLLLGSGLFIFAFSLAGAHSRQWGQAQLYSGDGKVLAKNIYCEWSAITKELAEFCRKLTPE